MKVVLTGPESSGKTTLALKLSSAFSLGIVHEAARSYLAANNEDYNLNDVRNIAQIQAGAETQALMGGQPIICDTDLLTILIWQKEKFGDWDEDIYINWHNNVNLLYLLCKPDIPWEPDPLRENPYDRDRLFQLHLELLTVHQKPFEIISGTFDQRYFTAFNTVQNYLFSGNTRM